MPTLALDYNTYDAETRKLQALSTTLSSLPAVHQKLVAEIALLRLFYLLENLISSTAMKIASGAKYFDGSAPLLSIKARSSQEARKLFQNHARHRPRYQLKWSQAREIKENVRHVIAKSDNIISVIDRHASLIDEIRRVRNRVAHNNAQSRKHYREVVRRHYGAHLNHITPGTLLLTQRKSPNLLEQYITTARILAADLVKR